MEIERIWQEETVKMSCLEFQDVVSPGTEQRKSAKIQNHQKTLDFFTYGGGFTDLLLGLCFHPCFHPFQLSSNIFHFEAQLKNGIPTVAGLNDANFYFRYTPEN